MNIVFIVIDFHVLLLLSNIFMLIFVLLEVFLPISHQC